MAPTTFSLAGAARAARASAAAARAARAARAAAAAAASRATHVAGAYGVVPGGTLVIPRGPPALPNRRCLLEGPVVWTRKGPRSACVHMKKDLDVWETNPANKKFTFDETDLESDEALWALYTRWRNHHKISRGDGEMARRFDIFKKTALYVHKVNSSDLPYKLGLNRFADIEEEELCPPLFKYAFPWAQKNIGRKSSVFEE